MALDNFGATNTCWHLLKPGRLVPTSRAIDHSWTSATAQRWAKLLQVLQASQLRRKCHYTISIQKSKGNCQQNLCQQLCQLIANRSNRSQIASNRSKRVWVVRSSRHSDSPWRASRSAWPLEVFWRAWQPSILISYSQKRAQISLFLLHLKSANLCRPPPHTPFSPPGKLPSVWNAFRHLWTSLNCRFCADVVQIFDVSSVSSANANSADSADSAPRCRAHSLFVDAEAPGSPSHFRALLNSLPLWCTGPVPRILVFRACRMHSRHLVKFAFSQKLFF